MRQAEQSRRTRETEITVRLALDGGPVSIRTGIGFFDHMLTALAVHGGLGLSVECRGDLEVDCHHTIEDVGIVLGRALEEALGDRAGIARYGSARIPMDEALACGDVDISGRPCLVFHGEFRGERIGGMDTQMVPEFFRALAFNAGITLHLNLLYGENDHHKAEALFKAFAHAFRAAALPSGTLPLSTKGVL
ncbi:MAG: imidazoleglycerol-phosphate dehydratase HisB [Oscillospiraceae bacterium]|jgi:imidazoleglycerol-phosphate dehydratase|nr:imidazoleglycerol-phosphate dehydratase HisB [Oscillospiraceae bacterium]